MSDISKKLIKIADKTQESTKMNEENFNNSNQEHDKEYDSINGERPTKRKICEDLESNVSTGSYQDIPRKAKKWNASKFKVTKHDKVTLDEKTEEGKYQRKVEEQARQREKCTEICFKTYSEIEDFKENMKVIMQNFNDNLGRRILSARVYTKK